MALDKVVDSAQLNACLEAEADAIRAKTGDSRDTPFDFANGKGFADAIAAIPSGGAERTKMWRPPDMPDITSLSFADTSKDTVYFTVDTSLGVKSFHVGVHSGTVTLKRGHVENGCFIVDEDLGAFKSKQIDIPQDAGRYLVYEAIASDYWTYDSTSTTTSYYGTYHDIPAIEQYAYHGTQHGTAYFLTPHTRFLTVCGKFIKTSITKILEVLDISQALNIFDDLSNLLGGPCKYVNFGNHKSADDANVLRAYYICQNADTLTEFDGSGLKVVLNATTYGGYFRYAYALETLNISGWDMSALTGFPNAFDGCYNLKNFIADGTKLPALNISLSNAVYLTDASLISIANALTGTTHTLSLNSTPKGRLSTIMGTVADGVFTADESGDTTLLSFINNTKGWTVA